MSRSRIADPVIAEARTDRGGRTEDDMDSPSIVGHEASRRAHRGGLGVGRDENGAAGGAPFS
ncbi:hypothetical protein HQ305_07160 [Rhodococcus sp. BP-149]|uniref:hypothetical protein n=1 Tax=unclassified Rhodococcus (in: high G+C Gram-positive bacteria) TaxID=192944 RepID=UPI001C9A3545|nr:MULTISPECIES: hypothetical protein [unclassified Rhodococcus (in: high G+C Gram-positive bacteria)]MBY6683915.1 hypothetical protein [Rhodococcus sp. BP-288]MBY6693424.1 hypothetical protein [Rhodococcus sp. BP-188]MBY6697621.1 hypothetical protein [Rhodococcus sp. BP-285]MBY6702298.1 hypothetical protein [Rhodococcus sp. BP-283]MBY6709769.1 hypothetical protein [Rhodococcus sp. BP-160]